MKNNTLPDGITQEMIDKNPHLYAEINIVEKKTGMIRSFITYAKDQRFTYENFNYELQPEGMNLIPIKNSFCPLYVFLEKHKNPVDFKNKNKHVPGRVLSLLYDLDTYRILIQMEFKKLNMILVILGIVSIIVLAVYGYINFTDMPIPGVR